MVFYLLTGRCESSFLPVVESTLVLILVDDGYFSVVFYLLTGRCNPLFWVIIIQFLVLIVLFPFGYYGAIYEPKELQKRYAALVSDCERALKKTLEEPKSFFVR